MPSLNAMVAGGDGGDAPPAGGDFKKWVGSPEEIMDAIGTMPKDKQDEARRQYANSLMGGKKAEAPAGPKKVSLHQLAGVADSKGGLAPSKDEAGWAKRWGMNAAAGADFFASTIGMVAGIGVKMISVTEDLMNPFKSHAGEPGEGDMVDRALAKGDKMGKLISEPLANPIQQYLLPKEQQEAYKASVVSKATDKVSSWIEAGTDKLAEHTGMSHEKAEMFRDYAMVMGPKVVKDGIKKVVGASVDKSLGKGADDVNPSVLEKYGGEPPKPPGPMDPAPKPEVPGHGVVPPGPKPDPAPQPPIGQRVGLDPKKGFQEPPKAMPIDEPLYTGDHATLDSALQKVREGKKFDLTPEERIALQNQGPNPKFDIEKGGKPKPPAPPPPPETFPAGSVPKTKLPNEAKHLLVNEDDVSPRNPITGKSAFDTGLEKIRNDQAFRMTAEEKVAVDRVGRKSRERGQVDPRLLASMIGITGGAMVGMNLADKDKLEGALAGGLVGLAARHAPTYAKALANNTKATLANTLGVGMVTAAGVSLDHDHPIEGALFGIMYGAGKAMPKVRLSKVNGLTIDDRVNLYTGGVASRERDTHNVSNAVRLLVPDPARREALSTAIESGNTQGLTGNERVAANIFRNYMDSYGQAAQNAGVLENFVQNYVTHVVEKEGLPKSKIEEAMTALFGEGRGSAPIAGGNARFAKERKYQTFNDLQNALQGTGLKIKTKDVGDIIDIYGRSMGRAIENKLFIDGLKQAYESTNIPQSHPYIMDMGKAPANYQTIDTPQMRGLAVHPELKDSLKFVLEADTPGAIRAGITALATGQKRIATSLSLFHASNLLNAYVGAAGFDIRRGAKPINAALAAYRNGGMGDQVDTLLRGGLKIEIPEDFSAGALTKVGAMADNLVEGLTGFKTGIGERALGGVEKIQRNTFDKVTWDYLHSGMKLAIGLKEFERLTTKFPNMPKEEVAKQVASFTNDTFGGLDWYRVATETQSSVARRLALSAMSPKGRNIMQIGMFAPDWTFSTFRSMYKALPGATSMPLTKALHQKYVLRTGLLYMTAMNGYNIAASGHPIWENKNRDGEWDPLRIHYSDGTTQQVAKHATEGPEWLVDPRKTALNKLGFPVKEPLALLMGKEWLAPNGKAPPMQSRTGHVLTSLMPIGLSGFRGGPPSRPMSEYLKRAALSAVGMPVYGMTNEELAENKEAKKKQRKEKKESTE